MVYKYGEEEEKINVNESVIFKQWFSLRRKSNERK